MGKLDLHVTVGVFKITLHCVSSHFIGQLAIMIMISLLQRLLNQFSRLRGHREELTGQFGDP